MLLETIRINDGTELGLVINKRDFNPNKHKLFGAEETETAPASPAGEPMDTPKIGSDPVPAGEIKMKRSSKKKG